MKHHVRTFACGTALVVLATLNACGGKRTIASKSAAAYDEARRKGIPVSAGEHGGHESETPSTQAKAATTETASHEAMPGMDHATMSGADRGHSTMAGMDHSAMQGMQHHAGAAPMKRMAGMDHGSMPGMDHSQMSGMQHGAMIGMQQHAMSAMQHGAMAGTQHGSAAPLEIAPPATNAAIAGTQPASTLRQDEFDAPAPAAVDEAKKASKPPSSEHHHDGGAR